MELRSWPLRLLAVAALVTLAGCAGVLGGAATTDGPTTTTTSAATTTDDPTTPAPSPNGTAALNGTAVGNAHVAQLRDAGSYTLRVATIRQTGPLGTRVLVTKRIDAVERRGLVTSVRNSTAPNRPDFATETYTAGNRTYRETVRVTDNESETQYRTASEPYDDDEVRPVNFTAKSTGQTVASTVDALTWNETGTTTTGGVSTVQYNSSGIDDATDYREAFGVSVENTSRVGATLEVGPDGVVRHLSVFVLANATESRAASAVKMELSVREVGSTTVTEPGWVATARNRTDG